PETTFSGPYAPAHSGTPFHTVRRTFSPGGNSHIPTPTGTLLLRSEDTGESVPKARKSLLPWPLPSLPPVLPRPRYRRYSSRHTGKTGGRPGSAPPESPDRSLQTACPDW